MATIKANALLEVKVPLANWAYDVDTDSLKPFNAFISVKHFDIYYSDVQMIDNDYFPTNP